MKQMVRQLEQQTTSFETLRKVLEMLTQKYTELNSRIQKNNSDQPVSIVVGGSHLEDTVQKQSKQNDELL